MALTKITAAIIEDGAITASALSDNSIGITQLNVSDGTSGQFLKTDGSGNLSFASVPAGYTDSDVDTKLAAGVGNILTTGYLAGPATFTIDPAAVGDNTGTVVIAGNLQVDGTTTTINSTTMTVDDLNITLASGAANAAAANGAGITVDGASATITYDGTNDEWDFNKNVNVTGTGQATRLGLGVAPHATAGLNITNTNQHIRLNNGSELGVIHVLSTGELELWGHGNDESINFRTGSGAGTVAMNIVGNNVGVGETSPVAKLHVQGTGTSGQVTSSFLLENASSGTAGMDITGAAGSSRLRFLYGGGPSTGTNTLNEALNIVLEGSSAGNVGIGKTPNRSRKLEVAGDINLDNGYGLEWEDGGVGIAGSGATDVMTFATAGAERMRIGSSGGITISNSPANTGESLGQPDMSKTTEGGIHFTSGGTQTSKGITWEAGGSGDTHAGIVCHNNDSNGTHLGFFTTYSYASGPFCQMKINSYGAIIAGVNVDVGSASAPSNTTFYSSYGDITVQASNGNHFISDLLPGYNRGQFGCMAANGTYMYFAVNGYYAAYLSSSGTLTASDERLKENVTTLTGSLDKINQLRGVSFNWKNEARGTGNNIGFIAQEVESVYPELVGDGGLPDIDGESPHKHVNYEKLVPALVEAIKELSAKLEAAEARITTLEG